MASRTNRPSRRQDKHKPLCEGIQQTAKQTTRHLIDLSERDMFCSYCIAQGAKISGHPPFLPGQDSRHG